jgi:hypothetical protein
MNKYMITTENGVSRIYFDKDNDSITGLAAANLTTCTAIVIIGDQGIAMIHDEGFLSIEGIDEQLCSMGKLSKWFVYYNATHYDSLRPKGNGLNKGLLAMQPLIEKYSSTFQDASVFRGLSACFMQLKLEKLRYL